MGHGMRGVGVGLIAGAERVAGGAQMRVDDSLLVRSLFDDPDTEPSDTHGYLLEYYERSKRFTEATDAPPPVRVASESS